METRGFAVDNVLRKGEDAAGVVLDVEVVVLEAEVHGVEEGHHLGEPQVHPADLQRAVLATHEGSYLVEVHLETLVDVLFPGALPTHVLLVLPVAQLQVVLHGLPVDGLYGCHSHPLLRSVPQQLFAVVFVQDVHDHCLDAADYLITVLEVGQFNGRVLFLELWEVLLLPLILGEEDIFLLSVWDEDVLQH